VKTALSTPPFPAERAADRVTLAKKVALNASVLAAGRAAGTLIGIVTNRHFDALPRRGRSSRRGWVFFAAGLVGVGLAHAVYGGGDADLTRRAALLFLITVPLLAPSGDRCLHHGAPAGHGWEWSRE
jgi:hypothetical protein